MTHWACLLALVCAGLVAAEPRVQQHRGLTADDVSPALGNHPYLFLSVPRGRTSSSVHGFQVIAKDDDMFSDDGNDGIDEAEDDDAEDDDDDGDGDEDDDMPMPMYRRNAQLDAEDDDEDDNGNDNDDFEEADNDDDFVSNDDSIGGLKLRRAVRTQFTLRNAKPTHMMVPRDQAGAIMVPDGLIEIEGQTVIDEKTGKSALLVPREALDAIPDGSVVALMERGVASESAASEEERANRVVVRRRRKGSRRNVRRRGGRRGNRRRRRRGGNRRRRRGGRIRNRRVVRRGGGRRRRRRRPIRMQG